jgi:hypothetical protein
MVAFAVDVSATEDIPQRQIDAARRRRTFSDDPDATLEAIPDLLNLRYAGDCGLVEPR